MKPYRAFILWILTLLGAPAMYCQQPVSIPAYTAYAVPAEPGTDTEESILFSEKAGLHNWTDHTQQIVFYFKVRQPGVLTLALLVKNTLAGSRLTASCAGKQFAITIPAAGSFKKIPVGIVVIKTAGFYSVTLQAATQKTGTIAAIQSLQLSGSAAAGIHFNAKPRRNAASVHLLYPLHDSMKVVSFYNEITVPAGADPLYSYYMACGFARGYFGIQVNSPAERRVIFSVWDAGNEATDRDKVKEADKVQLMANGEGVVAEGFGNEGTGGHSHWVYNWKAGETYKFLVTAAADSATQTTSYAGYFFIPETKQWKLIACFKAPKDGNPLQNLYSFVENFDGTNGELYRKAYFGKQWIKRENGDWKEITASTFSYDATGRAGDRIDYGGGTADTAFYLWNGGFINTTTKLNDAYNRKATTAKPLLDFYNTADSAAQAIKESAVILNAIKAGSIDTTGSANGIFYKILKEGTGAAVSVTDTVSVYYKGQLLNGAVFDATKEAPARFPLNRLIKGWQRGLPFCKIGGKIRLFIPSGLAYSIRNLDVIPPNSILIFEVEVLAAKPAQ
jgi:FKBP-type peptidyl-prolyl cis-trans isomerase